MCVQKSMFDFDYIKVTTGQRNMVKEYFTAMGYNFIRARFLHRITIAM